MKKTSEMKFMLIGFAVAIILIGGFFLIKSKIAPADKQSTETEQPTAISSVSTEQRIGKIDRQHILNTEKVEVIAVKVYDDHMWGTGLQLEIINHTEHTIDVRSTYLTANDLMAPNDFSVNVPAGESVIDTAYVGSRLQLASGIPYITHFEIKLIVNDLETGETLCMNENPISIRTSLKTADTTEISTTGATVIYDENGVTIYEKQLQNDTALGDGIWIYVTNKGQEDVTIASTGFKGKTPQNLINIKVAPRKGALAFAHISKDDMANGATLPIIIKNATSLATIGSVDIICH